MHHCHTVYQAFRTHVWPKIQLPFTLALLWCAGLIMEQTPFTLVTSAQRNCTGALACVKWFSGVWINGVLVAAVACYLCTLIYCVYLLCCALTHGACRGLISPSSAHWIGGVWRRDTDGPIQWDRSCGLLCGARRGVAMLWPVFVALVPLWVALLVAAYFGVCVSLVGVGLGMQAAFKLSPTRTQCPAEWANATAFCSRGMSGPSGCAGWGLFVVCALALIAVGVVFSLRPKLLYATCCAKQAKTEEEHELLPTAARVQ